MLKKVLVSGAAVAGALALTAPAYATTYLATGTTASSPGGVTPALNFTAPAGQHVKVYVQDCCIGGDYYAAYLDFSYIGTTPYVPQYGSVLSSGTFLAYLGGGTSHYVQLADQTNFYLPAGVYVQVDSIPEPATWALMFAGVFGVGGALRAARAKRQESSLQTA